jgi:hypothetical protein
MIDSARLAISLILASTLLISGIAKLRSGRFVADLANYRILPLRLVIPVATAMPPFEIALAALVLAWFTSAVPIYIAAVVLTLFATAMVVNLLQPLHPERILRMLCREARLLRHGLPMSSKVAARTGAAYVRRPC